MFCSLLNMKKQLFLLNLFCAFPLFHWVDIVKMMFPKVGGSEKRYKRGDGHIRVGVVHTTGVQTFCTL